MTADTKRLKRAKPSDQPLKPWAKAIATNDDHPLVGPARRWLERKYPRRRTP